MKTKQIQIKDLKPGMFIYNDELDEILPYYRFYQIKSIYQLEIQDGVKSILVETFEIDEDDPYQMEISLEIGYQYELEHLVTIKA